MSEPCLMTVYSQACLNGPNVLKSVELANCWLELWRIDVKHTEVTSCFDGMQSLFGTTVGLEEIVASVVICMDENLELANC